MIIDGKYGLDFLFFFSSGFGCRRQLSSIDAFLMVHLRLTEENMSKMADKEIHAN